MIRGRSIRIQLRRFASLAGVLLVFVLGGCQKKSDTENGAVLIFAAASLSDALSEVGEAFREETGINVAFNFAGSQTLAQQIAVSHRGDVFVSADESWMDFVAGKNRLEEGTRVSLLSNRLVLVSSLNADFQVNRVEDLCELDFAFLCIGDPDSVPAGRYARKWFEQENCSEGEVLWKRLQNRVSPAPDVRVAMEQVLGRTDSLGVVYRTDILKAENRAKLLLESPMSEIHYPAALLKGREHPAGGLACYDFLRSEKSMVIFERHGFGRIE